MSYDMPIKRQRLSENGRSAEPLDDYDEQRKFRDDAMQDQPNKVLLFTIINAVYPITTDVVNTICKPCGEVLRIVIFRKRGVQAMVEFNNIQSAQRAKASLNGADIYSGCCTLKIEWAKPARLNVYKNDDETWDYTGALDQQPPHQPALLGDAPAGYAGGMGMGRGPPRGMPPRGMPPRGRGGPVRGRGMMGGPRGPPPPLMSQSQQMGDNYGMDDYGAEDRYGSSGGVGGGGGSPVLMVYGLNPDKMNCERLFNVLCLYGNVVKVKFLKSKPGTAMVEMGDSVAVERAISNLGGITFYGEKLSLSPSKQMYLSDSGMVGELPDGTPSQKDFSRSKNNRHNHLVVCTTAYYFIQLQSLYDLVLPDPIMIDHKMGGLGYTPMTWTKHQEWKWSKIVFLSGEGTGPFKRFSTAEQAAKNRIQRPCKVLHYYNAPLDFDEEKMKEVAKEFSLDPPVTFTQFKSKSERSTSGLMEFEAKDQAMEALTAINHHKMDNPNGRFPYIMKLCFSTASSAVRE